MVLLDPFQCRENEDFQAMIGALETPAELEAKDGIYRHMKATQMEAAGWKL